ncbi:hypothetical protein Tco_0999536, partial [Tanacetum coccineum]
MLPKTNNVESSENPISIPYDLHNHDESLHISIPSDLDNHDESLHIPPPTELCEITAQVVRSYISGRSQLLNSSCDSSVEGGRGSASGYLKRKSPVSTSCDAFSRYSEHCGRNVWAKRSLDVPPAAISSNFGAVEQLDLEVFEKYSDMCGKNTVIRFSTPSMNVLRTANVINSQTIFSEPLRLNVSECWELNTSELVLPRDELVLLSQQLVLLEENKLTTAGYRVTTAGSRLLLLVKNRSRRGINSEEVALSHDRAHLNVAAEEVSSVNEE